MHPPRFGHPQYIPYQNELRSHGQRFGLANPILHKNRPAFIHSRIQNNFVNNNENHWCETCDRGFQSFEHLVNHKKLHQKCNIDGCQFIAHPKVIIKHVQMQHSTGLYNKIAKLDKPEEIQKWREERRKKYPTKENIEKRAAEIKAKIDRGEKMGIGPHRGKKFNRTEQGPKGKYSHNMNRQNSRRKFQESKLTIEVKKKKNFIDKNQQLSKRENKFIPCVNQTKTLKPFGGILNIINDSDNDNVTEDMNTNDLIEDDEYIITNEYNEDSSSKVTEPVLCGALTTLISNYESSDEESTPTSSERQNILETQKNFIDQTLIANPKECLMNNTIVINHPENNNDDDSGPEEAKIEKNVNIDSSIDISTNCKKEPSNIKYSKTIERKNKSINTKLNTKTFKPKLPSTLLEKLLHKEIRQERNIILQCIRYIVRNNYFENN